MAADVNEIISKQAIDDLKKVNQYFIDIDGSIRKVIDEAKSFDSAFRGLAATQKTIVSGQKEMQTQTAKMTQIQKDEAKALKATESAAASLNKQRQAALLQLAKQEAKERELNAALKLEVKTLQDAATQNKALAEARKKLDLTTKQGQATLKEYNATMTKNTEFIRQNATAMEKQRMNIGNYSSAFDGIGAKLAGAFSVTAVLAFGRAAFKAFEEQERSDRKLLFSLNNNKVAFKELTKQANQFQASAGVSDDAIQEIQVLGAEAGKSTEEIKKITSATVQWAALTGKDLQTAYLELNKTLSGTAGRIVRFDSAFGELTEQQLKNGAAIDLINEKYKGFAENAVSGTAKLSANWDEFKELLGASVATILVPALSKLNNALSVLTESSISWADRFQIMRTGTYDMAKAAIEHKKALQEQNTAINNNAIRNAESTKELVKKTVAERLAASAAITAEQERKKASETIIKQVGAYDKLSQSISDTKEQINNLLAAGERPSDALLTQLQAQEKQLYEVGKAAEFAALRLIAVQQGGFEPTLTAKGLSGVVSTAKAGKSPLKARTTDVGGAPEGTELFAPGEATQFAIDQAQTVADTTFQIMSDSANAEFDLKLSLLEKEKQARLSVAKTEEEKAKIEEKYAKKAAKIKTEQFKKQKAADIIQSIINTALAVTRALSTGGAVQAIAAGIAGAAQTAVISAQKVPQFDAGSDFTPSQFIAGERRPEFMITPQGQVQLVTRPTHFKNMAGATVISGEETAEIMKATGIGNKAESLAPYISRMESNIVQAITNKRELHISASGSRITERQGEYYKNYFNRKVAWVGKRN